MFKKPGSYDMIMRYSSLTPKILPDNLPAPRGIGMKVFGIEGEKIWGEDKKTQDWTFNNYPVLELRDPQTTYDIADSLERNWNNLPQFAKEQSERVDADVATLGGQLPRQNSKSITITFNIEMNKTNLTLIAKKKSGCNARILTIRLPPWRLHRKIRSLPTRRGTKEDRK